MLGIEHDLDLLWLAQFPCCQSSDIIVVMSSQSVNSLPPRAMPLSQCQDIMFIACTKHPSLTIATLAL